MTSVMQSLVAASPEALAALTGARAARGEARTDETAVSSEAEEFAALLAGMVPTAAAPAPAPAPAGEALDVDVAAGEAAAGTATGGAATGEVAATEGGDGEIVAGSAKRVHRDMALLAPEFRPKLERVLQRMRDEYGHKVEVLETYRTQERQEALYAQGRTEPGPVVTWTLNSNHRRGCAADLLIDGDWNNQAGFRHLAQIAQEEGLQTLGAKDPGHVELPRWVQATAPTLPQGGAAEADYAAAPARAQTTAERIEGAMRSMRQMPAMPYANTGVARVAEVARVATVAQVAEVAHVAQVATVATPGWTGPVAAMPAQSAPSAIPAAGAAVGGAEAQVARVIASGILTGSQDAAALADSRQGRTPAQAAAQVPAQAQAPVQAQPPAHAPTRAPAPGATPADVPQVQVVAQVNGAPVVAAATSGAAEAARGAGPRPERQDSARPGSEAAPRSTDAVAPVRAGAVQAPVSVGKADAQAARDRPADDEKGQSGAAAESGSSAGAAPQHADSSSAQARPQEAAAPPSHVRAAGSGGELTGVDVAGRVARILQLQEGNPVRSLSQVVLRLDDAGAVGTPDVLRVGLRGNGVSARLDLTDPVAADRISSRLGELEGALKQKGLEAEALRVHAAQASTTDAAGVLRTVAAVSAAELFRAGVDARPAPPQQQNPNSRDGGSPRSDERKDPNETHDRSRREREGGKKS